MARARGGLSSTSMDDFYTSDQRQLQDSFNSRRLADALVQVMVRPTIDDEAAAFIGSRDFFFLATVNDEGEPTVSYKGGAPGFIRVLDPTTLAFPSYDGNGMYLSMGNIATSAKIGLLFIDLETPHRLRVQASASLASDDDPIMATFPGAEAVIIATVESVFVNCGRYIHKHTRTSQSPYVPDAHGEQPLPAWKRIDGLQSVLPPKDLGRAEADGGTITGEEYARRLAAGQP